MATWSLRDLDLSDLIGIVRYVQSEVRDLDIYFKCRFACDGAGGRRGQDGSSAPQGRGVQTPGARRTGRRNLREQRPGIREQEGGVDVGPAAEDRVVRGASLGAPSKATFNTGQRPSLSWGAAVPAPGTGRPAGSCFAEPGDWSARHFRSTSLLQTVVRPAEAGEDASRLGSYRGLKGRKSRGSDYLPGVPDLPMGDSPRKLRGARPQPQRGPWQWPTGGHVCRSWRQKPQRLRGWFSGKAGDPRCTPPSFLVPFAS